MDSNKLDENKLRNCSTSVPSEPKWTNNPTKVVGDLGRTTVEQLENSVPVQVRNNLRALIGQCPEGIWCAEVPEKYR